MTLSADGSGAADLPAYAPIPRSALGPALNEHDYYVGRVERNLVWVPTGCTTRPSLATWDGAVLFDAPPGIGHNLQRTVNEVAAAEGVTNTVTRRRQMTDVTTDDAAEPTLSAADEQLLKELTERARAGGLIPGQ